jgi:N-acetyl-anhydromuramyl-L-alanine amidase AmpD
MKIELIYDKLPKARTRVYAKRKLRSIKILVVHHSGTTSGSPEAFAQYHVHNLGWPGIGYHYVIGQDATVYKTQPLSNVSYHARGANIHGVGICFVGDFNKSYPTRQQLTPLFELLKVLRYHLPHVLIGLHREIKGSRTSCPGMKFPWSGPELYKITTKMLKEGQ